MIRKFGLAALLLGAVLAGCQAQPPATPKMVLDAATARPAGLGEVRVALRSARGQHVQYALADIDRYVVRLVKDDVELALYDGDGSDVAFTRVPLGNVKVQVMAYQGDTPLNKDGAEASTEVTVTADAVTPCQIDLYLAATPPPPNPDQDLDQYSPTGNNSWPILQGDTPYPVAQRFVAGVTGTMYKVSLSLDGRGALPVLVDIYAGGLPGQPGATLIASGSAVPTEFPNLWTDLTFSQPPQVQAGQTYYMVATPQDNPDPTNYFDVYWRNNTSSPYTAGEGWSSYGTTWQEAGYSSPTDFAFKTFVTRAE